jgi:predicted RNase H-like HicB family nuclease
MLTNYIHHIMCHAHFELMDNGRFYGSIPGFQGVWSEGVTLEQCRDELVEVLEGWLIVKLRCGEDLPIMDGIDINAAGKEVAYA